MVYGASAQPVDKALVLLQSNQKPVGKQGVGGGFRIQTDLVCDATGGPEGDGKYRVIANCTLKIAIFTNFRWCQRRGQYTLRRSLRKLPSRFIVPICCVATSPLVAQHN